MSICKKDDTRYCDYPNCPCGAMHSLFSYSNRDNKGKGLFEQISEVNTATISKNIDPKKLRKAFEDLLDNYGQGNEVFRPWNASGQWFKKFHETVGNETFHAFLESIDEIWTDTEGSEYLQNLDIKVYNIEWK